MEIKFLGQVVLLGFLATVVQYLGFGCLVPQFVHYAPNFALVMVVTLGLFRHSIVALWGVFLIGIEYDLLSDSRLIGPTSFSFLSIYIVLVNIAHLLILDSRLSLALVSFLASVLGDLVVFGLSSRMEFWELDFVSVVRAISRACLLSLFMGFFGQQIVTLINRVDNRLTARN